MRDQQIPNDVNEAIKYHRQLASMSGDFTSKLATIHDFSLQLANYMSEGWWIHAIRLIDEHGKNLPTLTFLPVDKEKQANLRAHALELSRQEQRRFPKLFETACQSSGIPLDDSPHPRYSCDNHFIKITIDEAKQIAKIENYETELSTVPMDIAAIVYELTQIRKRLFARDFDAVDFVERLFQDYEAILTSEGLKQGDAVRIRSITKRRGKNIKGFRVDEFSVDLSRLLQDGVTETKEGYRLRLEQTKNTNQGMLLPGGQGYIGFIRFEK
jgi:hypothetical protein